MPKLWLSNSIAHQCMLLLKCFINSRQGYRGPSLPDNFVDLYLVCGVTRMAVGFDPDQGWQVFRAKENPQVHLYRKEASS